MAVQKKPMISMKKSLSVTSILGVTLLLSHLHQPLGEKNDSQNRISTSKIQIPEAKKQIDFSPTTPELGLGMEPQVVACSGITTEQYNERRKTLAESRAKAHALIEEIKIRQGRNENIDAQTIEELVELIQKNLIERKQLFKCQIDSISKIQNEKTNRSKS